MLIAQTEDRDEDDDDGNAEDGELSQYWSSEDDDDSAEVKVATEEFLQNVSGRMSRLPSWRQLVHGGTDKNFPRISIRSSAQFTSPSQTLR